MIDISLYTGPRSNKVMAHLRCTVADNTFPMAMPSRKWNNVKKLWEIPLVRLNIEFLRRNRDRYRAPDDFWDLLNLYGQKEVSAKFPADYPFKTEPRPYQLNGIKHAYSLDYSAMYYDTGTGKSKIAIDVASCRFYAGKIKRVLVVALFSIKDNWVNEINKHSPLVCNTHVLDTSSAGVKRYHKFLDEGGFQWLIVGVESFSNGSAFDLCQDFIEENMMMIVDESDSIKSHNSIRTERCIALSEIIRYKMIMTGTPIEKGMIDLYSQFQFLNPDIIGIGDYYSFKSRYAIMGGHKDKNIIGYHRTEELMGAVGKYISQVRKRDVLTELPESTYEERVVQLSAEQKEMYTKLKATLKLEYDNNKLSVSSSINLMQRLTEITGGFYSYIDEEAMAKDVVGIDDQVKIKYKKEYLKSNPKAKELMAFVDSLPDDEPVIIWAMSKMEVAYLVNLFKDKFGSGSVAEMHGDISREDRTIGLNDFQEYKRRFIIGNQAVGGVGLNMTAASIMIYFSNDFSLRRRIQSEGRIERIGQTRPMLYVDFVCAGTIDKYIVKSLREKSDFSEEVRRAFDSGNIYDLV